MGHQAYRQAQRRRQTPDSTRKQASRRVVACSRSAPLRPPCDVPGHRSDDGPGFFVVWDAPGLGRRYQSFLGYRTFGVSFGAVFCCVGAVVRVLKLGWPGFMGGQKVCLGSGFFVVVPRDKSV